MQHTQFVSGNKTISSIRPGTKILFANVPADGHFNPLTGLAAYLLDIGCDVRWYSSAAYANKIKKLQIPFYPYKKAVDWAGDKLNKAFPKRVKYKSQVSKLNFDLINAFILRSTEYYADISEIYSTFPFDVMVADIAFSGIPFVKDKIGVPVIGIGVLPLGETSKDLAPVGLGMTPATSFLGRRKQDLLRFAADRLLFNKPNRIMRKIMKEYGIETGKYNAFDILCKKSNLLLQSGTPGFEYSRSDLGKNIRFIGALLPHTQKKQQQVWDNKKLAQYKKVILATQGTVEKDIEKIIVPTLEAFKNSEYLVIATTGGSKTNELRSRYPQENFIIEDFIPFADVMPYANVYVTNGGYGGVMLGIENQLPLVVAGVHEGKNEINARIGYFGLGINLKTEKPLPRQIKLAVEKVMANDSYRSNVIQLGKELSQYNPQELCAKYIASILQPGFSETPVMNHIANKN